MSMPRVPTVVHAVLVPDERGVDLWLEIARAAANGQDVCLTPKQARKLLDDVRKMTQSDAELPRDWKS